MHLPSLVNLIPFPPRFFMKTLTSSCRPSQTSSTHLLPLALYHVIWRQPSSNLCWKSHHLTKIFWKTSILFLAFHFRPKFLKKLFSTNFSPISKKTTSVIPFSQPIKHSTETILLHIVNDSLSALDNDNISVLVLLDLSAAFDTIDHQILLSHLNSVFWHSLYCTPMVSLIPLRQISVHSSQ